MATRPTLERAVDNGNLTAPMFNDNFDDTLDYVSAVDTEKSASITSLQTSVTTLQGENIKVGTIIWFSSATIPTGYLICDGSEISRTTYSNLFNVVSTTFGTGDGSTTFNLPNLVGKYVQGGTTAGTTTSASTATTSDQSQGHTHSYGWDGTTLVQYTGAPDNGHTHTYTKGVDNVTMVPCIKY